MDAMDNILRIARGGKPITPEMSPAERVMQYALPQPAPTPKDNSAWGRFKSFAGSNGGRTLMGGLGTALAVGLTGGNFKDALGYGVMGAGNTVDVLNRNKQYANQLALKQQERIDAVGKEQRENKFKLDLQDQALAKSKLLADYQLEKATQRLKDENELERVAAEAERQRKIAAINGNPFLDDNQKQWQIAQLQSGSFDRNAYYTDKLSRDPNDGEALDYFNSQNRLRNVINPPAPLEFGDFAKGVKNIADAGGKAEDLTKFGTENGYDINFGPKPQSISSEMQAYREMVANGKAPEEALIASGLNKLQYNVGVEGAKAYLARGTHAANAGIDYGYETKGAYRDAKITEQKSQNDLMRDIKLKLFENSLPTEVKRQAYEMAEELNIPVGVVYEEMLMAKRVANQNTMANIDKTVADTEKINTEIDHPKADYNNIDSVRKEFNAITSDYRKVGDAFARIKASYENPTPAGDLSMVFNYMKALDPGSVVRESEFANAENARAWFDETGTPTAIRLMYEKAVKGGRLTPEQRTDFYNMAVKLYEAQKDSFDKQVGFYKELARRRKWNEDDIVSNPYDFKGTDSTNDDVIDYTDFLKGD